jgi:D-aspartate ligase
VSIRIRRGPRTTNGRRAAISPPRSTVTDPQFPGETASSHHGWWKIGHADPSPDGDVVAVVGWLRAVPGRGSLERASAGGITDNRTDTVEHVCSAERDHGGSASGDDRLPVVVTGADLPGGLSLARALRELAVPVYGLALDPRSECCRSSAWTEVLPVASNSEQGWVEELRKLAGRHPRQVLFCAQDTVVDVISRNREELEPHYRFVLPDHRTVHLLGDKSALAPWAEENGFPVPRTRTVSSPDELGRALDELAFPVVLKPFMRDQRWSRASGRNKAYKLDSPAAAARIPFPLFEVSDRYVVQEWIEGGDSDVHFCLVYRDRSGRELARQSGRKLVQWPVGTGNTALCTTTDDAVLHRLTRQFFDRAGLVGLASLEVKRDRRDGEYYITEPTVGRHDLQTNLATAAGVNLAVIAYHDARGAPASPEPRRHPVAIWMNESYLPPALVVAALRRQLDLVALGRALIRCRSVMFAYGEAGDLRPLAALLATKLIAGTRLVLRGAAARLSSPASRV